MSTAPVGDSGLRNTRGSFFTSYYTSVTKRMRILSGASLRIDPTIESLQIRGTGKPNMNVNGTLTIEGPGTASANFQGQAGNLYGTGVGLITGNSGDTCCSNGSLRVSNTGTLELINCTINVGGLIRIAAGGTFRVRNSRIYCHLINNVVSRIRCEEGANVDIDGLTVWGMQFDLIYSSGTLGNMSNYEGRNTPICIETGITDGAEVRIVGVPDYTPYAQAYINNWEGDNDVKLVNCAVGSATKMVPDRVDGTTNAAHGGRIYHQVNLSVVDGSNNPLSGACYYIADTDNGNRVNTTTADTASNDIDESGGHTYGGRTILSDAMGEFPQIEVLTAQWYRTNNVSDLAGPDGNEKVDVRSKSAVVGTDNFDIAWGHYQYEFSRTVDAVFKGTEPYTEKRTLVVDSKITEQDSAAVSAYITLENPQKLYDYQKYNVLQFYRGQQSLFVDRQGDSAMFGTLNVSLTSSGTLYSASGGTITINCGGTFTGNIITSGTVTLASGVKVNGLITDTSGLRVTVSGLPAASSAVAAFWPESQGADTRTNAVTGEIAETDMTSTSVSVSLMPNTKYYYTLDARGYRRSTPNTLDTSSQGAITASLELIVDTSGNRLIPQALTATEETLVEAISWSVPDIDLGHVANTPFTFNALAYAIEAGQSTGEAQSTLLEPVNISSGRIQFTSAAIQKWRRLSTLDDALVPDIQAITIGKDGSDDAEDYVDFSNGPIKYKTTPPVSISISPVAASQDGFNTLMANVPDATKDTYKGTGGGGGGGGGTALTQTQFNTFMDAVPSATKDSYKATIPTIPAAITQNDFNRFMGSVPSNVKNTYKATALAPASFNALMSAVPSNIKDTYKAAALTQTAFNVLMATVPDVTKDTYKGTGGGGGGAALTQTQFNTFMAAVPGATKNSFKATVPTIPDALTQTQFNTFMANVPSGTRDLYKGAGGGGGTSLTQTQFNTFMANVPSGTRDLYKAAAMTQAEFTALMNGVHQSIKNTYKVTQTEFSVFMANVPDLTKNLYKADTLSTEQITNAFRTLEIEPNFNFPLVLRLLMAVLMGTTTVANSGGLITFNRLNNAQTAAVRLTLGAEEGQRTRVEVL